MAIDALAAVNATATTGSPATSGRSLSALNGEDFLNLLIAQIRNQNPLDPLNADELLSQTAQLTTVQSLNQLNTNISSLLSVQQLTQASGLIGKTVTYVKPGVTGTVSGVIDAVNVVNGQAQLSAGADTFDLSQVRSVKGG